MGTWARATLLLSLIMVAVAAGCRKQPRQQPSDGKRKEPEVTEPSAESGGKKKERGDSSLEKPAPPEYTAEQIQEILHKRDIAVARLEAGLVYVEQDGQRRSSVEIAEEIFRELQELAPHERLPHQNLTVGRVFVLRAVDDEKREEVRGPALEATEAFLQRYPDLPDAYLLRYDAMTYQLGEVRRRRITRDVVKMLQEGIRRNPRDVRLLMTLFEFSRESRVPEVKELAPEIIERAINLAPDNIYVLRYWLMTLANSRSPRVAEAARKAREVFGPILMRVKLQTGTSLETYFDQIAENPDKARFLVISVDNMVKSDEIQKRDLARVLPNPMDFVLYEFEDERLKTPPLTISAEESRLEFETPPIRLAESKNLRQIQTADFDQDGWLDLWLVEDNKLTIRGGDRDVAKWKTLATVDLPPGARGVLIADLDRDKNFAVQKGNVDDVSVAREPGSACVAADVDVVVYGDFGCRVFLNQLKADGTRELVLKEQKWGLEKLRGVREAIFADLDMDYDLDLVTSTEEGTSFWLSLGAFRFANYDQFSKLPPKGKPLRSMQALDLDRDADIDVLAVDADGRVGYLENMLHMRFRWVPFADGFPECTDARAVHAIEVDGNASWDLVVTRREQTELWRTATRERTYRFVASAAAKGTADHVDTADLDNDGLEDLVFWGGRPVTSWQGRGPGGFQPWSNTLWKEPISADQVWVEDLDTDGAVDLLIVQDGVVTWHRNRNVAGNGWLYVQLRGRDDNRGRCNRHALGSTVELQSRLGYQSRFCDRPNGIHFGLGKEERADVMRVIWTNGMPQAEAEVSRNVVVCEPMRLKGSCPFVYTWNGKEFTFFTDCLWGAPLGLQVDDGVVVPTREWEYLHIPGKLLQADQDGYRLMLTEELWEAAYFDHVELLAVDHPPGVEIYSNEKVGPASIAEFRVHTVRRKRFPKRAVDSQRRDCAELLREEDGRVVQAFPATIRRGLAPTHYIDLDLGDVPADAKVVLFLTGWIFPTDASLNIAYAQDPELDGPVHPYVQMLDDDGEWRTVIEYMGFPGGKTKTIAVDLTGRWIGRARRVRIVTSAEIYWDRVFFTMNDEPAELRIERLPLIEATLKYRGFSASLPWRPDAPRRFDASRVTRTPQWVPMQGTFTRYGDVTELLTSPDDRMVVMGAGDAMICRFARGETPQGWERDFLLYSVGWDKDADLNTQYGQDTQPLPYRGMKAYPAGLLEQPVPSDAVRAFRRQYQTRRQDWAAFWKQLVPIPN